jgi:hypothetical protein
MLIELPLEGAVSTHPLDGVEVAPELILHECDAGQVGQAHFLHKRPDGGPSQALDRTVAAFTEHEIVVATARRDDADRLKQSPARPAFLLGSDRTG